MDECPHDPRPGGGALTLGGFLYGQPPDLNQEAPWRYRLAGKASALGWLCFCTTLVGAGSTIALGIRRQTSARLLGAIIGLWVIGLHLPRVLAAPAPARRGELSSLLEAIAYTGTALLIAAS